MDEETESDEEPVIIVINSIVRSVTDRVKEKKKEKNVPLKLPMKDIVTNKDKTKKGTSMTKRRKVESKADEKNI